MLTIASNLGVKTMQDSLQGGHLTGGRGASNANDQQKWLCDMFSCPSASLLQGGGAREYCMMKSQYLVAI